MPCGKNAVATNWLKGWNDPTSRQEAIQAQIGLQNVAFMVSPQVGLCGFWVPRFTSCSFFLAFDMSASFGLCGRGGALGIFH